MSNELRVVLRHSASFVPCQLNVIWDDDIIWYMLYPTLNQCFSKTCCCSELSYKTNALVFPDPRIITTLIPHLTMRSCFALLALPFFLVPQAIADQTCLGAKYGIGSAIPFTHDDHPYHMCMVLPTLACFVSVQMGFFRDGLWHLLQWSSNLEKYSLRSKWHYLRTGRDQCMWPQHAVLVLDGRARHHHPIPGHWWHPVKTPLLPPIIANFLMLVAGILAGTGQTARSTPSQHPATGTSSQSV